MVDQNKRLRAAAAALLGDGPQLVLVDDGKMVKPKDKVQRTTILLRDIPADVPEEVRSPRRIGPVWRVSARLT